MAELMNPDRWGQLARVLEQSVAPPRRPIPTLHWTADAETGRPMLSEDAETFPFASPN